MSDYYDVTPKQVAREGIRWLPVVLGVIALVAGLVLLMWWGGWWFSGQNINRQARITQNSYENQTTLHAQIDQNIANVNDLSVQVAGASASTVQPLEAERTAVVNIVCHDAAQITSSYPLNGQESLWVARNCFAGSISPSSQYFVEGK